MSENYLSFGVPTPCLPRRCVFKCFFMTKATLKKEITIITELKHDSAKSTSTKYLRGTEMRM